MSDNEIEDVSFLPGDSLHRKARYEPNVVQRLRMYLGCTRPKVALTCLILILVIVIIALSVTVASLKKDEAESTPTTAPSSVVQTYIATNGQPFPYKKIKLPKSVVPYHYSIFMHPNITRSIFSGKVTISCHVTKATDFVMFHIKMLNISSLSLKETKTGNQLNVVYYLEYTTNEQVYVKLGTSLEAGTNFSMTVEFKGALHKSTDMSGFYRSSYNTTTGETRYIATTHFEPTDARAAFPCMDEPSLKATFDLTMVREPEFMTLFNMPLKNTADFTGGLKSDTFQTSVRMSTYLVAFVVCDYERRTKQTKRNITVGVNAPKDMIDSASFALDVAVKVLDYYEEFFGVNYPLPKQDLVAIPDFSAGAMENWGLITYRLTAILYDPAVSTAKDQMWVAIVVAHELAHQWFGNLVTMKWWNDLWLNEGFASYVEYLGASQIQPEWKMLELFVSNDLMPALHQDSLQSSHPINVPVDNPNQINEVFDDISYHKGASIIRMLRAYIGDDAFKTGLSAYLKKYQFGNAVTNDLWNALSQASPGQDIPAMMNTWTEQMGYPVITLTTRGSKVTMTQSRFVMDDNSNITSKFTSPYGYLWEVPFTYVTSVDSKSVKKKLLKDKSGSFDKPAGSDWIKGNYGMFGFYRVNYDEANWKALIQALHVDHTIFSQSERAGLIDDAFYLARAGHLNYTIALDLTNYMVKEQDYLPWKTLLESMGYLESRLESKAVYGRYRQYMLKLMSGLLKIVDDFWEDKGTVLHKFLGEKVLAKALHFEYLPVVQKGKHLFDGWKNNNTELNKNLKAVVYSAGIRYGYEEDWEYIWDHYMVEHVTSEKMILLGVLGTTRDSRLLSRLLEYGLDATKVKSQDTGSVIGTVAGSSAGQLLAWRFFQQNWDEFRDRYADKAFVLSRMIKQVTTSFGTQFDYNEVQEFFRTRDVGSGKRAVSQALEYIQSHINWSQKYEGVVTEWFQKL